jgi:hypothetical protein
MLALMHICASNSTNLWHRLGQMPAQMADTATSETARLGIYTGFSLCPVPRQVDLSTDRALTRQVVGDNLSWLLGLNAVREGDSGMDLERVFRAHDQVLRRYNESREGAETSTLFTQGTPRSCVVHSSRSTIEVFRQAYAPRNTPQFNALQLRV